MWTPQRIALHSINQYFIVATLCLGKQNYCWCWWRQSLREWRCAWSWDTSQKRTLKAALPRVMISGQGLTAGSRKKLKYGVLTSAVSTGKGLSRLCYSLAVIHFSSFFQVHQGIIDSWQPKIQYPKETWNSRGVFLFSQHKLRESTSSSSRFVRRSTTWTPHGPCYIWLYGSLQSCQEQHLAYMLAYSIDSFNVLYLLPVHNF